MVYWFGGNEILSAAKRVIVEETELKVQRRNRRGDEFWLTIHVEAGVAEA